MEQIYDMIVIGGGPAGYTAALYAARSGLSVVVLEKLSAGGQMALTEQIDNYPGLPNGGCYAPEADFPRWYWKSSPPAGRWR